MIINPTASVETQAAELFLIALAAVWLYVGIRDYLFTRRMTKAIKEIRERGLESP